jgi:hypothetical protein
MLRLYGVQTVIFASGADTFWQLYPLSIDAKTRFIVSQVAYSRHARLIPFIRPAPYNTRAHLSATWSRRDRQFDFIEYLYSERTGYRMCRDRLTLSAVCGKLVFAYQVIHVSIILVSKRKVRLKRKPGSYPGRCVFQTKAILGTTHSPIFYGRKNPKPRLFKSSPSTRLRQQCLSPYRVALTITAVYKYIIPCCRKFVIRQITIWISSGLLRT